MMVPEWVGWALFLMILYVIGSLNSYSTAIGQLSNKIEEMEDKINELESLVEDLE